MERFGPDSPISLLRTCGILNLPQNLLPIPRHARRDNVLEISTQKFLQRPAFAQPVVRTPRILPVVRPNFLRPRTRAYLHGPRVRHRRSAHGGVLPAPRHRLAAKPAGAKAAKKAGADTKTACAFHGTKVPRGGSTLAPRSLGSRGGNHGTWKYRQVSLATDEVVG